MQNSEEIRRLVDTNRTAVDALIDPSLTARAKADHKARTDRTPYVCPIPDDMTPPIGMSSSGG